VTGEEIALGILLAALAGLGCAIGLHLSGVVIRTVSYPLLIASQTIPIPMIAPVLVLWLGFGLLPKVIVVAIVSFFPIVVTTLAGFAAVDADMLKLMRTFDASRLATFRYVELPAALPGVFAGAKLAVVFAAIGAVFAEQAGSSAGLGYLFQQSIPQLLVSRAYAAVAVLSVFAIAMFAALTVAERLALPWAFRPRMELAT
jgi:ABC-type nitrate/sulfonate/bicarbonate transport system permease component